MEDVLKIALRRAIAAHDIKIYNEALAKFWAWYEEREIAEAIEPKVLH